MDKKVLIGTVTLERDQVVWNNQFQYAASFEQLLIPAGEYPIYAYESDLKKDKEGRLTLGWRNYIGYEGTVISGNIGNKPGAHSRYDVMTYDYILAGRFLKGYDYYGSQGTKMVYQLRPAWTLEVHDFVYENRERHFSLRVVKKHGETLENH